MPIGIRHGIDLEFRFRKRQIPRRVMNIHAVHVQRVVQRVEAVAFGQEVTDATPVRRAGLAPTLRYLTRSSAERSVGTLAAARE